MSQGVAVKSEEIIMSPSRRRTYADVAASAPKATVGREETVVSIKTESKPKPAASCMKGIKTKKGTLYNFTRRQRTIPKAKATLLKKPLTSRIETVTKASNDSASEENSICASNDAILEFPIERPPMIVQGTDLTIKSVDRMSNAQSRAQKYASIAKWIIDINATDLNIPSPVVSLADCNIEGESTQRGESNTFKSNITPVNSNSSQGKRTPARAAVSRRVDSNSSLSTHKRIGIINSSEVVKGKTQRVTSKSKTKVTGAATNVPINMIRSAQIIQQAQATQVTNKTKCLPTAVCPICKERVARILQHLQRTCMPDSRGFDIDQRKSVAALVYYNHDLSKLAIIKTSELLAAAYQTNSMVNYIEFVANLLEMNGINVIRDAVMPSNSSIVLPISIDNNNLRSQPSETIRKESKEDTTCIPASPSPPRARSNSGIQPREAPPALPTHIFDSPIKSSSSYDQPMETICEESNDVISVGQVCPLPQLNLKPVISPKRLSGKRKIVSDITSNSPVKKLKGISTLIKGTATSKKGKKVSLDSNMSTDSSSTISLKGTKYTNPVNVAMSKLGFYNKFDFNATPILIKFDRHLATTLFINKVLYRNQLVANVNRVLYKLHPAYANPDILADTAALKKYFDSFPSCLAASSKANYIKALNIFIGYCSQTSEVREKYTKLIESIGYIRECLGSIRTGLAKSTSRRMAERKASQFRGDSITIPITDILNCVDVLKDKYIKYLDRKHIHHMQLKSLNTYFNAVITLKNAQRPSVFSNMQLHEFQSPVRTETSTGAVRLSVGVVDHKTASTQLATVSFTETEYEKVRKYIEKVRPSFAKINSPTTVFINRNGLKVHNPSSDLRSRQIELGLRNITSTDARHSYGTLSARKLGPEERNALATYLAHSLSTANANYVNITTDKIQAMVSAITVLQDPDQPDLTNMPGPSTSRCIDAIPATIDSPFTTKQPHVKKQPSPSQIDKERLYKKITEHFTINEDDDIPKKWDIKILAENNFGCSNFDDKEVRRIRARLDYIRNTKRSIQVISYFPGIRPSDEEINKYLTSKDWYNKDTFSMVVKNWTPISSPYNIERLKFILGKCIKKQKWPGLVVQNGILLSKVEFYTGQIVCDYHADILTHDEGMTKYDSCDDNTYRQNMYFFNHGRDRFCLDGNLPCSCHDLPSNKLQGRLIPHAIDGANVVAKVYYVGERPHLIFEAIHNIPTGTSFRFDKGAHIETKF
ncbi:hypothetical protein ACJMK2_004695 [Sinanodonta woodiana]|uniref:Uncharacterized protein n=1 Tax=Sinanodonta woodiana TaxID=1069815 RepID=A0ABD3VQW9_SINWO